MQHTTSPQPRWRIVLAFACVYFFWGSTFVAIRYGVRYLSPFFVSGLRTVTGALVLLAVLRFRGVSFRMRRDQFLQTALVGLLLVTVNNSMLGFAELYVTAGYAALLTASVPIIIAVIETAVPGGKPLSRVGWAGTVLGLVGLGVLLWPALRSGIAAHGAAAANPLLKGTAILLCGLTAWIAGSLIVSRRPTGLQPFVSAGMQMLVGGSVNVLLGSIFGAWKTAHWNAGLVAALLWLAIGGSLIGFTAYTYLLQNVAVSKVTTNAYVNPVVAVLLSAAFLGETLHGSQWFAMGIILTAVAIVTASKSTPKEAP